MKRSGMVLFGALLWLAWHLGTLSAPAPQSGSSHGHWTEARTEQPGGSNVGLGLQRFAVESERFLGHSAHILESDWHHMHPLVSSAESLGAQAGNVPRDLPVSNGGHAIQSGLAMAWHQVEPLLLSVQPIAKAGWDTVQFGWRQLTQSQLADNTPSDTLTESGDSHRSHAHGWRHHPRRLADNRSADTAEE